MCPSEWKATATILRLCSKCENYASGYASVFWFAKYSELIMLVYYTNIPSRNTVELFEELETSAPLLPKGPLKVYFMVA